MSRTFLRPDPRNDAQMTKVKAEFETLYGVNSQTRNPQQWKNLVEQYGMTKICETEKLTPKQVRKKMKHGQD